MTMSAEQNSARAERNHPNENGNRHSAGDAFEVTSVGAIVLLIEDIAGTIRALNVS